MDVNELCAELEDLEISKDLYSVMQGEMPNEKFCLVYENVR